MKTDPVEDYTRGWVPFLGQKIYLDSHPLIPRLETEWWVEKAIANMSNTRVFDMRVLDLCAGSGAIGIAVLAHIPSAIVDFGEIEARHFPTILKSVRENHIDPSRARMIETDIWSHVTDHYDVVLANPPYIDAASNLVAPSVTMHEPHEALFAKDHGFALIERALSGVREHLNKDGSLWIEHEPSQTTRLAALAHKLGLSAVTHTDQYGRKRYTVAYCRT